MAATQATLNHTCCNMYNNYIFTGEQDCSKTRLHMTFDEQGSACSKMYTVEYFIFATKRLPN